MNHRKLILVGMDMLFRMLTTLFKLHAVYRMRSCIRTLTTAFLAFQLIAWGLLFIHNEQYTHTISPNGEIVHIQSQDIHLTPLALDESCLHADNTSHHNDSCPAMEHALRTTTPVPVLSIQPLDLCEIVTISQEVIAKKLEIVYLSHLTLRHAPKQSPPVA